MCFDDQLNQVAAYHTHLTSIACDEDGQKNAININSNSSEADASGTRVGSQGVVVLSLRTLVSTFVGL